MIILLFILITYFYLKGFFRLRWKNKVSKTKKNIIFNKNNLNKWMNLNKKERYNLSKQESITYLNKRKMLLEEIRKEYKKNSKNKAK